jgi:hypothetical protein
MTDSDTKAELRRYLQAGRDALVWKLDGLTEYDVRRPLVPTGTNLLGLVKHLAGIEAGYFGDVFGRPFDEPLPWIAPDAERNADMWATPGESREHIVDLYRRVWTHADGTIAELDLAGRDRHRALVAAEHATVTLHRILVHVIAETHRHAGHADLVRELIDGAAGVRPRNSIPLDADREWWSRYRDRLEDAARQAGAR